MGRGGGRGRRAVDKGAPEEGGRKQGGEGASGALWPLPRGPQPPPEPPRAEIAFWSQQERGVPGSPDGDREEPGPLPGFSFPTCTTGRGDPVPSASPRSMGRGPRRALLSALSTFTCFASCRALQDRRAGRASRGSRYVRPRLPAPSPLPLPALWFVPLTPPPVFPGCGR